MILREPFQIRTKSELFREEFSRFVQERFPLLTVNGEEFGPAWRYRLTHNDQAVFELETLPVIDDSIQWLGIKMAQPQPQPREQDFPHRLIYQDFAPQFIQWVEKWYEVNTEAGQLNYGVMFHNAAGEASVTGFADAMVYEARKDMKFDDPEKDAERQAYLARAEEGLPPVPNVPNEQGENLNYLEPKILEVIQRLRENGRSTGDEDVAAHLPHNSRGKPYTREWINRKRNAMRRRGIDV